MLTSKQIHIPRIGKAKELGLYFPLLLAFLIMLPRLFSPQFGLFDDGNSLFTSQFLLSGGKSFPEDTYDARFRPVYWLSFALIYFLFGPRPFWFFLANTLVLMATTWSLMRFVENLTKSRLQAFFAGLVFVLGGPVIENFYTLSKGEPWQVMFLMLSLLVVSRHRPATSRLKKLGVIALAAFWQSLAHMAKETSVFVMLPFAFGWWLIERFTRRRSRSTTGRIAKTYLLATGLSTAIVLVMREFFVLSGLGRQGYTTRYLLTPPQITASLIRWSGWLIRDFVYIAPLGIAAAMLILRYRRCPQSAVLLSALLWTGGWIAVFLPWHFMTEYYMLPAAVGLSILTSTFVILLLCDFSAWKGLRFFALGLATVLFLLSLFNNRTSAGIQLAVDAANEQMLAYVANAAPANSTVIVNIRDSEAEYPKDIDRMLDVYYRRPDIDVTLPQMLEAEEARADIRYILAPYIQNQPLLTVRLGVFEPSQESWNAALDSYLVSHPGWQQVAQLESQVRLSILDFPRLFCPLIQTRSFCATPSPLVDIRLFSYGWKIYRSPGP